MISLLLEVVPLLFEDFIQSLSSGFAMKDLGSLHYFLGIEVHHLGFSLFLSQTKYASDILIKAGMIDCKPCDSPEAVKVSVSDPLLILCFQMHLCIGALRAFSNILHLLGHVKQNWLTQLTWYATAVQKILRFVKGTQHHSLYFTSDGRNYKKAF